MTDTVRPIPEGYEGTSPYIAVAGAAEALDFYKRAFGAVETFRHEQPDGRVGHAEITIGRAVIMLADEHPEIGFYSPKHYGGSPVHLHIYVEDVDALVERAAAEGALVKRPPADQPYGDRNAGLEDPFGHSWFFSTHVEDVAPEELERRFKEKAAQSGE
jgi:PhnB protein